jgi:NTE family protein
MVEEHWQAGARDMRNTIAHPEWLQSTVEGGVTTFDLTEPGPGKVKHPGPESPATE